MWIVRNKTDCIVKNIITIEHDNTSGTQKADNIVG